MEAIVLGIETVGRILRQFDKKISIRMAYGDRYEVGEEFYVAEKWQCTITYGDKGYGILYEDGTTATFEFDSEERAREYDKYCFHTEAKWESPLLFPYEAARLHLRVQSTKTETRDGVTECVVNFERCESKTLTH